MSDFYDEINRKMNFTFSKDKKTKKNAQLLVTQFSVEFLCYFMLWVWVLFKSSQIKLRTILYDMTGMYFEVNDVHNISSNSLPNM